MNTFNLHIEKARVGYKNGKQAISILSNVTAEAKGSKVTALIGLNGSGKSTLIKTICGFLPLLEGSIKVNDCPIGNTPNKQLAKLLSVVLTRSEAPENMPVHELLQLARYPHMSNYIALSDQDKIEINKAVDTMQIAHLQHKVLGHLSDGELRKVYIARALAQQTPILILDEPTAFLDFKNRINTYKTLQHLAHKMGKTILISTHDIDQALNFADALWVIHNNTLITCSPAEFAKNDTLKTQMGLQ